MSKALRVVALSVSLASCAGAIVAAHALGHVPARSPRPVSLEQTFDMVPGERVTVDGTLELTYLRSTWGTATPRLRHRITDVGFSVRRAALRARDEAGDTSFEINDGVWSGLDARRVGSRWVDFVDGSGERIRLRVLPFPDPPKIGRAEASAIALRAADTDGFGASTTMNERQRGNVWQVEVVGDAKDVSRMITLSADDGHVIARRHVGHN